MMRSRWWLNTLAVELTAGMLACGHAAGQMLADSDQDVPSIMRAIRNSNQIYLGWRVFQDYCAPCHGTDATGTDKGPDLRPRVKTMSRAQFITTVLHRYQWILPSGEASSEGGAQQALIQGINERKRGLLVMPARDKEPSVKAHIADLYDYLQARASGALAPGRPPRPGGR